jgi:hypothetical protein
MFDYSMSLVPVLSRVSVRAETGPDGTRWVDGNFCTLVLWSLGCIRGSRCQHLDYRYIAHFTVPVTVPVLQREKSSNRHDPLGSWGTTGSTVPAIVRFGKSDGDHRHWRLSLEHMTCLLLAPGSVPVHLHNIVLVCLSVVPSVLPTRDTSES